jgi:uncharacterized protein YkwD
MPQTNTARFCGQCGAALRGPLVLLPQRDQELLRLEAFMVQRVNEERRLHNLAPLMPLARLASVSRAHSAEMWLLNYFEHESPTPELRDIRDRFVLAFGERPRYLAENIAHSQQGWADPMCEWIENAARRAFKKPWCPTHNDIEKSHQGLMNSPGHRANILAPEPTQIGIGIYAQNGGLWVTQMFWQP